MTCPHCKNELPEGLIMCFHCGEALETPAAPVQPEIHTEQPAAPEPKARPTGTIKCPHCQSSLPDGLTACFRCGKSLRAPVTMPPRPAQEPAQPKQASGKKNGLPGIIAAAVVVLLISGAVGGHFMGLYTLPLLPEKAETDETVSPSAVSPGASTPGKAETPNTSATPDSVAPMGFADGFHSYTNTDSRSTYVYEGYWKNGLPNGEGTLTETRPLPDNPNPDHTYPLTVILQGTFVDGYAHGAMTEIWHMDNGGMHTWAFTAEMGYPLETEVRSSSSDAELELTSDDMRGIPPWVWDSQNDYTPTENNNGRQSGDYIGFDLIVTNDGVVVGISFGFEGDVYGDVGFHAPQINDVKLYEDGALIEGFGLLIGDAFYESGYGTVFHYFWFGITLDDFTKKNVEYQIEFVWNGETYRSDIWWYTDNGLQTRRP